MKCMAGNISTNLLRGIFPRIVEVIPFSVISISIVNIKIAIPKLIGIVYYIN